MDSGGQTYLNQEGQECEQGDSPPLQTEMAKMLESGTKHSIDEQIARVFRRYDEDKSGELTIDEFQPFYRALVGRGDFHISDAQIQQVFRLLDDNGDGVVTLDEFQLWWKTKLQIDENETIEMRTSNRIERHRGICREFLDNADAIVFMARDGTIEGGFESNLLPRLVALLGDFSLRGLAFRHALNELVVDPMQHVVSLDCFLVWYDHFERAEQDKVASVRAKLHAQAELGAQLAAREQPFHRALNEHDVVTSEHEIEQQRDTEIAVLFNTFNTDQSGLLDVDELSLLLKALGCELSLSQVNRVMRGMDVSGDGRINLQEFLAFWKAFKHRRPNVATRELTRHHVVLEPESQVATMPYSLTRDVMFSNFEMVKERAFESTRDDLRGCLTSFRDFCVDKQMQEHEGDKVHSIIPKKRRVYGVERLDVTWIDPEILDCVMAMIVEVKLRINPLLRPDATQRIQALVRGHLARKRVFAIVCNRYSMHFDVPTRLFYFIDTSTGSVLLTRPLYPTSPSANASLECNDCSTKAKKYLFDKRLIELRAKKKLYDQLYLPLLSCKHKSSARTSVYKHRATLVYSAFYMYDVLSIVQKHLHSNIWTQLCSSTPDVVLLELIAQRRPRQLLHRSHDSASLPLHHVLRHLRVNTTLVRTIVNGYPQALSESDGFGMTPLHIALSRRHPSIEVLNLLAGNHASTLMKPSIWARQTVCGNTPLHVTLRHRTSIRVLEWALSACENESQSRVLEMLNERGESAFHACITQQQRYQAGGFTTSGAKRTVLLFFKHFDNIALCTTATKRGDLPLHLALAAFYHCKQRRIESVTFCQSTSKEKGVGIGWVWLIELLLMHYPAALVIRSRNTGLLPLHLAIKYGLPEDLAIRMLRLTADVLLKSKPTQEKEEALLLATTIATTRTTLVHYALMYRPEATKLLSLLLAQLPSSCRISRLSTGDLPIHTAAAAYGLSIDILQTLCREYDQGCRTYNHKRYLPLHIVIVHDAKRVDKAQVLWQCCSKMILAHEEECCGLRALLMAANAKVPDYQMLLTLLHRTPNEHSAGTRKECRRQPLMPFYALSMRRCTREITTYDVAKQCYDQSKRFENEEAEDLALAKGILRRQRYKPTSKWTFDKIVHLMKRHPSDEALIQRALYALNEKLRTLQQADERHCSTNNKRKGYGTIVATVTLNKEMMLVRTVHRILYDVPTNPRIQILGQAILKKLLPSPYIRATYRAKIDPYFNL